MTKTKPRALFLSEDTLKNLERYFIKHDLLPPESEEHLTEIIDYFDKEINFWNEIAVGLLIRIEKYQRIEKKK